MVSDSPYTKEFTDLADKAEGERRANREIQTVLVLESCSSPECSQALKKHQRHEADCSALQKLSHSTLHNFILIFHILGNAQGFLHGNWLVSLPISCLQQAGFHMAFLFSSKPRRKWERSGLSARSSFSAVGLWRVGYPEKNRTMDKII